MDSGNMGDPDLTGHTDHGISDHTGHTDQATTQVASEKSSKPKMFFPLMYHLSATIMSLMRQI